MTSAAARQSPRIDCRIPVELAPHGETPERDAIAGRSINVSEGGMAVGLPRLLPVGDEVVCHLQLEGRRASLSGQVTWAQARAGDAEAGARVGIRFGRLSGSETDLLQQLLSAATGPGTPVALRFEGFEGEVVARGEVGQDRVRLSAALPILARGTRVELRVADDAPTLAGEVVGCHVAAHGRTPVLEVDVGFIDGELHRERRHTLYGQSLNDALSADRSRHDTAPDAPPTAALDSGAYRRGPAGEDPEQDTTPDPLPPVPSLRVPGPHAVPRARRMLAAPFDPVIRRPGWGAVLAAAVTAAAGTWAWLTLL